MIVQAYLERKPESLCTVPCQVEKVVELSAQDFDAFVFNPLAAREFIAENKKLMRSEGIKNHCLLVLGRDRADGVLVNSEGTEQVRYAAYLPCARTIVNAAVEQAAERIVREGIENTSDGTWRIRFDELRKQTGLVVTPDNGLGELLLEALRRHPEIAEMEVSGKYFGATYKSRPSAQPEEFPARPPARLVSKILDYLAEHDGSEELYQMLHGDLGFTNEEIDALGFDLAHCFEDEPGMTQPQL